jgi:AcrR family transcriptional regulator
VPRSFVGPRGSRRRDRRGRTARAEGRDAREELLRAAAAVFAERGFRDASVEEIAQRAGYSKGALYWHFASKDDLFFALMDASVEAPTREMIDLLQSAPPQQDMALEGSRRFVEVLQGQRELLLLEHEYWSQAVRDPELRARYASHRAELRAALASALEVRLRHLGAPPLDVDPRAMATVLMGLTAGLARERLLEPGAVPDDLLGWAIVLLYRGILASAPPAAPGGRARRGPDGRSGGAEDARRARRV